MPYQRQPIKFKQEMLIFAKSSLSRISNAYDQHKPAWFHKHYNIIKEHRLLMPKQTVYYIIVRKHIHMMYLNIYMGFFENNFYKIFAQTKHFMPSNERLTRQLRTKKANVTKTPDLISSITIYEEMKKKKKKPFPFV